MSVKSVVRTVSLASDRVLPKRSGVSVLIYHRVGGDSDSPVDLSLDVFRAQMELLAAEHKVLSLDVAVTALAAGESPQGVVITFDDGAVDFCDQAVPVMVQIGLPSTLYLVTSAPDAGELPWGVPAASWAALRESVSTGLVSVQSHTHDHRVMHRVTSAEAAVQLNRSIELIGTELGERPQHFAYPKAVAGNRAARAAVAERFRSAALAGHRVNRSASGLQRLGRVPISRSDDLDLFRTKVAGGLRMEGWARDVYGRWRYRGVTT